MIRPAYVWAVVDPHRVRVDVAIREGMTCACLCGDDLCGETNRWRPRRGASRGTDGPFEERRVSWHVRMCVPNVMNRVKGWLSPRPACTASVNRDELMFLPSCRLWVSASGKSALWSESANAKY